jgi:hypothetical protein
MVGHVALAKSAPARRLGLQPGRRFCGAPEMRVADFMPRLNQ